jgi:hypothetical protein
MKTPEVRVSYENKREGHKIAVKKIPGKVSESFSDLAKDVSARMPECVTTLVRIKVEDRKLAIFFKRPCHVP